MAIATWLQRILEHHKIPYEERHHPPVSSALHLAQAEHVTGHRVAKTVILANHGRPLSVVLPASARLELERVREVMGNPDLRLASEQEIGRWFRGCTTGAVPPLRLRADECMLMDRSLGHLGKILFAAGCDEDAVSVPFRAWYRAVQPGVGRFAKTPATNGHARTPPTVLVVEDETDTNQLLCCLLEREGYACRGALKGGQALALAAEVRPTAILLDLMLPDMSGFTVYEQLRRIGPLKRIPVIVVTALDDAQSRRRGHELGVDAYLTKPFRPDTLLSELHGLVEV